MKLVILITLFFLFLIPSITYASTIKINEFYAAGGSSSSNSDWVEIYNEGMDISLYQLIDADNHKKDLSGAICNSHFCTIDWYNLLNKDGDIITLTSKLYPDTPIDQVKYGNFGGISAPGNGQSAVRNPDITGDWIITSSPTKGTSNNTSTPTPTVTPTSTPTITPSPSPAPPSSSSFTITNIPSQISSDQSFNVSVDLSLPKNSSTIFYLKGAFKKSDSSNYFGQTKVSGNWIKNSSTHTNQYKITTDSSGNWSGNLEIKPDSDDSGFTGSGSYMFKVGRYKDSDSSSVTWSNESNIEITQVSGNNDAGSAESTLQPLTNSTNNSIVQEKSVLSKATSAPKVNYLIATVAAVTSSATPSSQLAVKNQKQINAAVLIGLILVFAGASSVGYIYLKRK